MSVHPKTPAAVLWDMDGTLIDTETYWVGAEVELASQFGVAWTRADGYAMVGTPLPHTSAVLAERGVDMPIEDIAAWLVARVTERSQERLPWQDDARRLLDRLVAAEIPLALVTMSYRPLANVFLAAAPPFAAVVTGDEVVNGKPDPEAYLTAAALLGVDPADCLAIEDSPSGTRSAVASGARTVGIQREVPVPQLPGLTRLSSLDQLDDALIARVLSGEVVDLLAANVA